MQNPCLHWMPLLQVSPGLLPRSLLGGKQVMVASRQLRAFGKLSVYPLRILTRPRQRYLELVWSAVTVASIEGLTVDLAGGELIQSIEQAKTCKLTGFRPQPGRQRVGSSIADQTLQPLSGGDEGGSAGSSSS